MRAFRYISRRTVLLLQWGMRVPSNAGDTLPSHNCLLQAVPAYPRSDEIAQAFGRMAIDWCVYACMLFVFACFAANT